MCGSAREIRLNDGSTVKSGDKVLIKELGALKQAGAGCGKTHHAGKEAMVTWVYSDGTMELDVDNGNGYWSPDYIAKKLEV